MRYRNDISILGYGCMRFTTRNNKIDIDKAEKEILKALELGVNYFDTAYIYPGSEEALGIIMERNRIRDKIILATKLPQYFVKNRSSLDRYLNEELKRLRTDHLDVYLLHHMTDYAQWEFLESVGIREWIEEKKKEGRIRNIGFSFHGNTEMFLKILNAYDWDTCLVQYNYMDETSQAGREGIKKAYEKGVKVFIMEPLRGGKLVDLLPSKAKEHIANDPHGWTPAEWAFRWLWDQKEITCVLSGMNSIEMIEENCKIASEAEIGSYGGSELKMISDIKEYINENTKVNCTGCRYCQPCPKGVDIPGIFAAYNHMFSEGKRQGRREYFQAVSLRLEPAEASLCIKCGKCELHCPQSIPIREKLVEADKALRPLHYKVASKLARHFMVKKRRRKSPDQV